MQNHVVDFLQHKNTLTFRIPLNKNLLNSKDQFKRICGKNVLAVVLRFKFAVGFIGVAFSDYY